MTMERALADRCLRFVEEQSCGEWGETIERADAAKLAAFVRQELTFAAEQPAEGWRQISEAPRDGNPFLAWNKLVGVYNTAFYRGKGDGSVQDGCFPCGFWGHPHGVWYPVPTHWRPLPAPPAKGRH